MLISIEIQEIQLFSGSDKPGMLFFLLINVKMPTVVGILIIMSRKIFMLSRVEHEKSFITSSHGLVSKVKDLLLTYYLLTIHNGEVKYLRTNKSFERITLFHCIYFRKLIVRGDNGILYAMLRYQ